MGNWYDTCCISNLPIPEEREVLLIPLVERYKGRRTGLPLWQPLYVPIRGEYDGYGGLEDARIPYPALWAKILSEEGIEVEGALQKLCEKDLEIRGGRRISHTFVREDVWEALLERRPDDLDKMRADADQWVSSMLEIRRLDNVEERVKALFQDNVACEKSDSAFLSGLCVQENGPGLFSCGYILKHSLALVEGDLPEDALENSRQVARLMADLFHVDEHMDTLRRAWEPKLRGKGSQDLAWEEHEAFAELVGKIAQEELYLDAE